MQRKKVKPKGSGQFLYLGRWVEKDTFRTFVYNGKEQKLANSYGEYQALTDSGLWFNTPEIALEKLAPPPVVADKVQESESKNSDPVPIAASKVRKLKDGANS